MQCRSPSRRSQIGLLLDRVTGRLTFPFGPIAERRPTHCRPRVTRRWEDDTTGLRLRRRIPPSKHVGINGGVGGVGVSVSVPGKGIGAGISTRGRNGSVGIPGSGLSHTYEHHHGWKAIDVPVVPPGEVELLVNRLTRVAPLLCAGTESPRRDAPEHLQSHARRASSRRALWQGE